MFNNNSKLCLEYGQLLYNKCTLKLVIVAQHYRHTLDTLITVIM